MDELEVSQLVDELLRKRRALALRKASVGAFIMFGVLVFLLGLYWDKDAYNIPQWVYDLGLDSGSASGLMSYLGIGLLLTAAAIWGLREKSD